MSKSNVWRLGTTMLVLLLVGAGSASAQVGVGVTFGTGGIGVDVAVPIASRINIRAGGGAFTLSPNLDSDGIAVAGKVKLSTVNALVDLFPFGGGFHVSPGVTVHNGTKVTGVASVSGNTKFSLGGADLISNPANPVTGNLDVSFKEVAPTFLLGWGNLSTRHKRRWSIQFDMGVILSKQPTATMVLNGSACATNGTNCRNIATDPGLQADLQKKVSDLNSDLNVLQILPVISIGFGYRLGK